jgi:hypothetical protein
MSYCILAYVEFLFIGIVAIVKFIFIDSHIGCRNCQINIYLNFYVHTQVVRLPTMCLFADAEKGERVTGHRVETL